MVCEPRVKWFGHWGTHVAQGTAEVQAGWLPAMLSLFSKRPRLLPPLLRTTGLGFVQLLHAAERCCDILRRRWDEMRPKYCCANVT